MNFALPLKIVSAVSADCSTLSAGSSETSFCNAPESLTSSLRSFAIIASA